MPKENRNTFFKSKGEEWRDKDYRFLRKHFPIHTLKGTLLDVGCGLGDGIRYLKTICPHITQFYGMDASPEAIKTNRNNKKMRDVIFYQHNIEGTFTKKFDHIICSQVIEHLNDPLSAIDNLIEATNINLIISTPNLSLIYA